MLILANALLQAPSPTSLGRVRCRVPFRSPPLGRGGVKFLAEMYANARSDSNKATSINLPSIVFDVARPKNKEKQMSLGTILLIVLVLALLGVIPTWGHSSSWGYGPSGGIGLVLLIVVILVVMGKL